MIKQKVPYRVYRVDTQFYEDGRTEQIRTHMGDTWAVSEAQACNNVAHRTGDRLVGSFEWRCDEGREWFYEAVAL